jgi:hypothetical protein
MRKMIARAAALFCLAILSSASLAASPATIPLRITAKGESVNRADDVTISVVVSATGATPAAARAANAKRVEDLTKALVARGIDRSAVSLARSSMTVGFVGNEAFDEDSSALAKVAQNQKSAMSTLQIHFGDPALIARVRETLDEQDCATIGGPRFR